MNVLGQEVELQVATDLRARTPIADAVQDDFLRGIQRSDDSAILLSQFQASRSTSN